MRCQEALFATADAALNLAARYEELDQIATDAMRDANASHTADARRDANASHTAPLVEERNRYKAALEEIRKGEGEFSRDHLTHCQNTVEALKGLADAALAPEPEHE